MPQAERQVSESSGKDMDILNEGKNALHIESQALSRMASRLGGEFVQMVHLLDALIESNQHLIVTGIGKSGLVAGKIAAMFSSIGLPSVFLHAAEASHGDLGLIKENDTILAVSNSGETEEILKLLPAINRRKCTLVAMTGNPRSTLAGRAQVTLDISVEQEACSLNLVPTASTTAALALGDALAVALLKKRGFKPEDFAQYHPGGSLGRKLLTTVEDLMHTGDALPRVSTGTALAEVLETMSTKRLGVAIVVDDNNRILGIITDGDIRRLLQKRPDPGKATASEFMSPGPKTLAPDCMATRALQMMEEYKITGIIVSRDGETLEGFIHLHGLLQAGIA